MCRGPGVDRPPVSGRGVAYYPPRCTAVRAPSGAEPAFSGDPQPRVANFLYSQHSRHQFVPQGKPHCVKNAEFQAFRGVARPACEPALSKPTRSSAGLQPLADGRNKIKTRAPYRQRARCVLCMVADRGRNEFAPLLHNRARCVAIA